MKSNRGFTPPELIFAMALVVFVASVSVALLSAIDRAARADQARSSVAGNALDGAAKP